MLISPVRNFVGGAAGAFCRAAARAFTATSAMAQEASLGFFGMGRKGPKPWISSIFIHQHGGFTIKIIKKIHDKLEFNMIYPLVNIQTNDGHIQYFIAG